MHHTCFSKPVGAMTPEEFERCSAVAREGPLTRTLKVKVLFGYVISMDNCSEYLA
jgi:hypothetical protein